MKPHYLVLPLLFFILSCTEKDPQKPAELEQIKVDLVKVLPVSEDFKEITIVSDKAMYSPGEPVQFRGSANRSGVGVRYWHLGETVSEVALESSSSWNWNPPSGDFQGYYAELVAKDADGNLRTLGTCAVDVSSTWTKFPRYGFLSRFGSDAPANKRTQVMSNLNRHHINGIQFYEWAYDHHHPLCGTPENPGEEWDKYLTGSTCRLDVIQDYIKTGHDYNMASMFYDLNNGVFEWCEQDGCGSTWYTYLDRNHQVKDKHDLNVPPFRSDLYLVDPNLQAWRDYFAKQVDDVYKVFDFDGFHIDQLGNRGTIYDYDGKTVNLPSGYEKVINTMKQAQPGKDLVFNAVSGYGQKEIASAPVSFLYNEVWEMSFGALKTTLDENHRIDPSRNTVIAAYIHNKNEGYFNTPAVLMLDAVLFAMGASHIELGENMTCQIYWPTCKLEMKPELQKALVEYYDFLTGYENLLRDGGKETKLNVTSQDIPVAYWEPSAGKVNVYGKLVGGKTVVHLLNFKDAGHMNWRDDGRTQAEPGEIREFRISVPTAKSVRKVWTASPDYEGGAPREVDFKVSSDRTTVTVNVPYLKYWTMVVIE